MSAKLMGLVISGGNSSRMGQDKTKLQIQGQSLRTRAFFLLKSICPKVLVSVREEQIDSILKKEFPTELLKDQMADIGPAAALLAAQAAEPQVSWLVLACDYALADAKALHQLVEAWESEPDAEVLAFVHPDGTPDPLFAIWRPLALKRLQAEVQAGRTGPLKSLLKAKHRLLTPHSGEVLTNLNEVQDWQALQERLTKVSPSKS